MVRALLWWIVAGYLAAGLVVRVANGSLQDAYEVILFVAAVTAAVLLAFPWSAPYEKSAGERAAEFALSAATTLLGLGPPGPPSTEFLSSQGSEGTRTLGLGCLSIVVFLLIAAVATFVANAHRYEPPPNIHDWGVRMERVLVWPDPQVDERAAWEAVN